MIRIFMGSLHLQYPRMRAAGVLPAHGAHEIRYPGIMIGRLRGELLQKLPGLALVECGGVGYVCSVSLGTYGALPEVGREAILHVETLLRENDLSLLGFATLQERDLYRLLVKVDGVGPRLALASLGAMPLADLLLALRGRDVKTLTRIPGVGRKTAEKLCFELSERLGGLMGLDGLGATTPMDAWENDLRSALVNLGFKEDAVLPVIQTLRKDRPPMVEAIRMALKALQR
jgi:Holliday junction DNA helicase RuvA